MTETENARLRSIVRDVDALAGERDHVIPAETGNAIRSLVRDELAAWGETGEDSMAIVEQLDRIDAEIWAFKRLLIAAGYLVPVGVPEGGADNRG